MGFLGGYLYWKVVLEFWFGHPKCHFRYPPKRPKWRKENRKLIKEFKMRGNYEMKKGGEVNAFNLIQAVEEDGAGGQGADVDIEDLDMFFDDLKEDE